MNSKKRILTIILVFALALIGSTSVALAQGPSGSYVTGISCVNLTNASTDITIEVFASADDGGASLGTTPTATIGGGGNVLYFTGTSGDAVGSLLSSGQVGSAVVSSGASIACSLNTQTTGGTQRVATSNGINSEATASKLFVPQVVRLPGIFNSYVALQNAGGASAQVTAKFFDGNGNEVTAASQTVTIPSNSSHVFYQDTNTALGSTFNGSATFESNNGANLAATVVLYDDASTLLAYDGFASGSTSVEGPRFVKNISNTQLNSGLACQNLSGGDLTITAEFSILNQATQSTVSGSVSKTVGNNQSFLLSATSFGDAALDAISAGFGSVKVTASGDFACTFNENALSSSGTSFAGTGSTYNGLPSTTASTTISFPQVVALGSNSFRGGFQYANTTGTAATCSHTYSDSSGTLGTINNVALAGSSSNSIFAETDMTNSGVAAISAKAQGFNGSVAVTCDQPIVGIYNLAATTLGGDTFVTNTGVNQ